jgi:hypothetical protein
MDELDGVIAAPRIHTVLFEIDEARVVETRIAVGERTPLHTHLAPTVNYVISGSHFVRRDEVGEVVLDTRAVPAFSMPRMLWSDSLERHTLENSGDDPIAIIGVELKHPGGG